MLGGGGQPNKLLAINDRKRKKRPRQKQNE